MSLIYREYSGFFPHFMGKYDAASGNYWLPYSYSNPNRLNPGDGALMAEISLYLFMLLFWASKTCALSGTMNGTATYGATTNTDDLSWTSSSFVSPVFSLAPAQRVILGQNYAGGLLAPLAGFFTQSPDSFSETFFPMTDANNYNYGYSSPPSPSAQVAAYLNLGAPVCYDPSTGKYYLLISFSAFSVASTINAPAAYNAANPTSATHFASSSATFDLQVLGSSIFVGGPLPLTVTEATSGSPTKTASGALIVNIDSLWDR